MATKRKLKVTYILANSGGMFHYLVQLANAIAEYANVTVLAPKDVDSTYFTEKVEVKPILDFSLQTKPNVLRKTLALGKLRIINELDPDIIHITDYQPIVAVVLHILGINRYYPLVYTDHDVSTGAHANNPTDKLSESLGGFFNHHLINYDRYIVHGNYLKNYLKCKGIPDQKISIIPHGSYTLFHNLTTTKNATEEKNTVLFFGYLKKYKGLEYLIKATPQIQKQIPDFKVIIAGQGEIRNYFGDKRIPHNFEVHNKMIPDKEVEKFFSRSQLLVLPYVEASQSGPLHIALATGKPIVATRVGALPEVVKHGWNGIIVNPRDEEALATAIIVLLKDDKLRAKMGKNAQYTATHELSWDNIAKKTLDMYEKSIKSKKHNRLT